MRKKLHRRCGSYHTSYVTFFYIKNINEYTCAYARVNKETILRLPTVFPDG